MVRTRRSVSEDDDDDDDTRSTKFSPKPPTRRKQREEEEDDVSVMKPRAISFPSRLEEGEEEEEEQQQQQQQQGTDLEPSNAKLSSIALRAASIPRHDTKELVDAESLLVQEPRKSQSTVSLRTIYATAPGAVSVGGYSEIAMDKTEDYDSLPALVRGPEEPQQTIEAHLAPDDAEIEARITERVEDQITKQVKEQMLSEVVMATAVKKEPSSSSSSSSRICGCHRSTFVIFLVLVVIVIVGGAATAYLFLMPNDDDDDQKTEPPTAAPTIPINDTLFDELRSWIAPTPEDLVPFYRNDSAQAQALEWLHSDLITISNNRTTETVLQRYVLAVLFFSTSGRGWHWQYLSPGPVCGWNIPVVIDEQNSTAGVICTTDDETVDGLVLLGNNLRGQIPWELVLLTNLYYLDLDFNSILGSIPSRIGELTNLEYFYANANDIQGNLPASFAPTMKVIDVRQNLMTGSIPKDWDKLMPNLEQLYLSSNSFTGTIPPELGNIVPLRSFHFFGTSFTGSVDQFFCGNFQWTSLVADCEEVECPCCTDCCYADSFECVPMS